MESTKYEQPELLHAEPVLAVRNVTESVAYWQEVLGFPSKWIWDPPYLGGVSWLGGGYIQFSENQELAAVSAGHSVWIRMKNVASLYALHQKLGAEIVSPLEKQSWQFYQYTVREINGYYIHFAEPAGHRVSEKMPHTVHIKERRPTLEELAKLRNSVGWTSQDSTLAALSSPSIVYSVVAENTPTGEVVGCAILVGDNGSFYYIRDVIVDSAWQGQQIGTAMMRELVRWLEANATPTAMAGLFTGDHLISFYKQFGFTEACGMYRQIKN